MRKKMFGAAFCLVMICTAGYAQNESYTETRTVGSFNAINVCCGTELCISEGNSSAVIVETNEEKYLPMVKTEVKEGELWISIRVKSLFHNPGNMHVRVYVSANNLTAIKASAGASVESATPLSANEIEVSADSGSGIELDLTAASLKCSSSSGSSIEIKGRAGYASVSASTGSDIDMDKMITGVATASASTGSSIRLNVTDVLKAKASTGGDIAFKGNPKTIDDKESLGGEVRQLPN
ncbi:MAG: DUF2807 domain-containing protein [Tannerellaceae bacterium]|jgi:hypothetical protein|nr:DUF2807 domain-containing protein [Tannerellaceae bacterium]